MLSGLLVLLLKSFSKGGDVMPDMGGVRCSFVGVRSPPTPARLTSGPARFSLFSVLSRKLLMSW